MDKLGRKTGGRKKGSKNRLTKDVEVLIREVFKRVKPVDKLEELLGSEDPRVSSVVLLRLMDHLYGKPKESIAVSGAVDVYDVVAAARARIAQGRAEMAACDAQLNSPQLAGLLVEGDAEAAELPAEHPQNVTADSQAEPDGRIEPGD